MNRSDTKAIESMPYYLPGVSVTALTGRLEQFTSEFVEGLARPPAFDLLSLR